MAGEKFVHVRIRRMSGYSSPSAGGSNAPHNRAPNCLKLYYTPQNPTISGGRPKKEEAARSSLDNAEAVTVVNKQAA